MIDRVACAEECRVPRGAVRYEAIRVERSAGAESEQDFERYIVEGFGGNESEVEPSNDFGDAERLEYAGSLRDLVTADARGCAGLLPLDHRHRSP